MKVFSNIFGHIKSKSLIALSNVSKPQAYLKQQPIKDVVELSGEALEKKLMKEVREYGEIHGLETARVIDKSENILNLKIKETPGGVEILDENFISLLFKLEDSNYIHNHPLELPLSPTDISTMLDYQISKMTATMPSGAFSTLILPKHRMIRIEGDKVVTPEGINQMQIEASKIGNREIDKLKKLNVFDNDEAKLLSNLKNAPKEIIKELSDFRTQEIQNFANRFELEYKYKLAS